MDKQELRNMVAELLRDMSIPAAPKTTPAPPAASTDGGCLDDITEIDLRKQYLVEHPANKDAFLQLKARTPARIGVGRAGARYKTITQLRVRADHAAAQDSVFSDVPEEFWKAQHWTFVQTMCKDKDEYLTRPDLGRRFDEEQQAVIKQVCGTNPRVLIVIGDGLSSAAVMANAPDCAAAIRQGLSAYGITPGESLFIKYCRVGASDAIGAITDAELVCMLVGERPGLTTAESMSAYLTYKPYPGIPEAKRTVVSNIHKHGTPAVEAGAHIAELIKRMLEKKASGIDLRKEEQA
jgi:ethanolamine ammonia-lyase small subunit